MAWSKDNSVAAKLAAAEALAQAQRAELAAESVDDVIAEVDVVVAENKTRFLTAVATVALRDSTYPTPLNGDTVRVTGTSTTYRFSTGSGWVVTDVYNATAIDNVTAQLAQTGEQLQSIDNYRGGIVTIIDDDSYASFLSRWKPIADAQGIKISIAVNTSWVGTTDKMTLPQLQQLKSEGYDILSHGYTHPNMNTMSLVNLENEWNLSKQYLIANGLGDGLGLVYPVGLLNITDPQKVIDVKTLTRKYYKYGIDANTGDVVNSLPVDNYEILRQYINPLTVTLPYVKKGIDDAKANGKWYIILTHVGDNAQWDDVNSATKLNEIIDYIQSLGMPILSFREAEKLVGNVISHGDSRTSNYHFVSKTGATWQRGKRDLVAPMSVSSMDALITEYPKYLTTKQQIANTQDTYISKGGVLETYRGDSMFSYQAYYPAQSKEIYRRTYNDTTNVWSAWSLPFSSVLGAENVITPQNGWTGTLTAQKDVFGKATIKGDLTVGTNSNTIVANIPTGYRPLKILGVQTHVKSGAKINTEVFPFAIYPTTGNIITTVGNGLVTGDTLEFVVTYQI